jgi:hypothetical protein
MVVANTQAYYDTATHISIKKFYSIGHRGRVPMTIQDMTSKTFSVTNTLSTTTLPTIPALPALPALQTYYQID